MKARGEIGDKKLNNQGICGRKKKAERGMG